MIVTSCCCRQQSSRLGIIPRKTLHSQKSGRDTAAGEPKPTNQANLKDHSHGTINLEKIRSVVLFIDAKRLFPVAYRDHWLSMMVVSDTPSEGSKLVGISIRWWRVSSGLPFALVMAWTSVKSWRLYLPFSASCPYFGHIFGSEARTTKPTTRAATITQNKKTGREERKHKQNTQAT